MFEEFASLVARSRSVRRFGQGRRIGADILDSLAEVACHTPSAGNLQPLRYVLVSSEDACEKVFGCLGWAAYLKDWNGPEEGERPSGYFIICNDPEISRDPKTDAGIVAQTVMLAAGAAGYGGCILGSVNRKRLVSALDIPEHLEVLLVLALGAPAEEVMLESLPNGGDVRYWRDARGIHHVPKRTPSECVVGEHAHDSERKDNG